MIPKIELYNFFLCRNGAYGSEYHTAMLNEIAQTKDFFESKLLSNKEKRKFEIQNELFPLMSEIDFTLSEYSFVEFFSIYNTNVPNLSRLAVLIEEYFEDSFFVDMKEIISDSIEGINLGIEFYENYINEIKLLNDWDDPEYDKKREFLESKLNFSFNLDEVMYNLYELIIETPDFFCVDEDGKSIDPEYTGKITFQNKIDGIKTIYNLEKGEFKGEAVQFFKDSKTIHKVFIKQVGAGMSNNLIKEWHPNGQLKYEAIGYLPELDYNSRAFPRLSKGWHENGEKEHESTEDTYISWYKNGLLKSKRSSDEDVGWYENGQKEYESIEGNFTKWYDSGQLKSIISSKGKSISEIIEWHENGQKKLEKKNNITKFWDNNGKEISSSEYIWSN